MHNDNRLDLHTDLYNDQTHKAYEGSSKLQQHASVGQVAWGTDIEQAVYRQEPTGQGEGKASWGEDGMQCARNWYIDLA